MSFDEHWPQPPQIVCAAILVNKFPIVLKSLGEQLCILTCKESSVTPVTFLSCHWHPLAQAVHGNCQAWLFSRVAFTHKIHQDTQNIAESFCLIHGMHRSSTTWRPTLESIPMYLRMIAVLNTFRKRVPMWAYDYWICRCMSLAQG